MIYLDYNATTMVDERVFQKMEPFLKNQFGNPSSSHTLGRTVKKAMEEARESIASLIHTKSEEVIFTSSGSEANNMILKGVANSMREKGTHIIASVIEHPSILEPLEYLKQEGYEVTTVAVDEFGQVDPKEIEKAMKAETILVTVMHSNNEVGTLQPIEDIAKICKKHHVYFHTDASQSMGKVQVDVKKLGVDFLTIAGHKMYAPIGIGALYIKEGIKIEPLIHGASQERGFRAGTENIPYIVALGEAARLAKEELYNPQLRDYFETELKKRFDQVVVNGHPTKRLPNTANISFLGYSGHDLIRDLGDVAASTGSACHEGLKEPSRVLSEMGYDAVRMQGAIRFSLGRFTSKDELDEVLSKLDHIL